MAVYTGIFPPAKDEAGLAVVLGHEVAHALARHGAERMSQSQLLQLPAVVGAGFGVNPGLLQAYGLGAAFGIILPFSRSQELEADRIGLRLMAEAGYDPRASLDLWERMEKQAAAKGQGAPPGFMSTHPGYEQRTQQLREWIPEALKFYRASRSSPEPLPSLETLNTPEAMAERALLKKIEAVNQQSGDQRRAEAMLRALQDRIGGSWSELVREFNGHRVSVGEFAALKGTSYLGKVPMAQVVGSYKNNATWTEITQRQGIKVTDLLSFLTDLIRLQARWR